MIKSHWCLIVVIVLALVLLFIGLPQRNSLPGVPICENGEIVREVDRNDDGNVDVWIFADQDTVIVRMVRDTNFDGRPDTWDYFKNGKPSLAQEDQDHDGTIDFILIQVHDEEEKKARGIIFLLEGNIFVEDGDTGWVEEGDIGWPEPSTTI